MKTLVRKKSGIYEARLRVRPTDRIVYRSLGTRNKEVAQKKMDNLYAQMEREDAGIGIPEKIRRAAQADLKKHIKEYLTVLGARASDHWVTQVQNRLTILANECNWNRISDIQALSFESWRAKKNRTPKTLNDYRSALNSFMKWLVKNGYAETNPIESVENIPIRGRHKFKRRSFTIEELNGLMNVSELRRPVYLTAAFTGLRRGELKALEWGDVHLKTDQPYIVARASTTKNGKEAVLPLHPDLVDALLKHKPSNAKPSDKVFATMPNEDTVKRDLKMADIEQWNDRNEKLDFHALRKTFCTLMHTSGIAHRTAQELMRHSDPKLTNQVYMDTQLLGKADAVNALPSIKTPQIAPQKSGTAGHCMSQTVKERDVVDFAKLLGSKEFCHALAQTVAGKEWRSHQESNLKPPDS